MEVNKNKIYYYVANVRISIKLSLRRTLGVGNPIHLFISHRFHRFTQKICENPRHL